MRAEERSREDGSYKQESVLFRTHTHTYPHTLTHTEMLEGTLQVILRHEARDILLTERLCLHRQMWAHWDSRGRRRTHTQTDMKHETQTHTPYPPTHPKKTWSPAKVKIQTGMGDLGSMKNKSWLRMLPLCFAPYSLVYWTINTDWLGERLRKCNGCDLEPNTRHYVWAG